MNENGSRHSPIFTLLKSLTGQTNILTIPVLFIDWTDSHEAALLLSQIIYWSGRTTMENGWFAKSYAEWYEELRLSKYKIMGALKKLQSEGVPIQTEVKKFRGAPTVHYRLPIDEFQKWIVKKLDDPSSRNLTNDSQETLRSSTETTAETTAEKDSVTSVTGAKAIAKDRKPNSPLKEKKVVVREPVTRPPNPLFDVVALEVFNTDPAHVTAEGGRIGQIAHWLAGKYAGKGENHVGYISAPAKPEHVTAFVAYWKKNNDPKYIRVIQNFVHFVEEWRAWASTKPAAATTSTEKPKSVTFIEPDWDILAEHEERKRALLDPEIRALLEKYEAENGLRYGVKLSDVYGENWREVAENWKEVA